MNQIKIVFTKECQAFLESLEPKAQKKIVDNTELSFLFPSKDSFKKLNSEIWEFRTEFNKMQYRLLAFWDKRNNQQTLVVAAHGFVKKQWKVSPKEILKVEQIMKTYFRST